MNVEIFENIIMENLQFPKDLEKSNLWKTLMDLGLKREDAIYAAARHCNSLSFYALCRANEWIMFSYSTWVEKLVEANYLVIENGWVKVNKTLIADLFGFGDKFNYLSYVGSYDILKNFKKVDTNKAYQIKVYSNSNINNVEEGGTHFMGAYFIKNVLYLTDSGNRGKRVKFIDVVPKEKFIWGLEV